MNTQTSTQTRSIWQATRPIVATPAPQSKRPARANQTRPTPQTKAEQEAERWVVEMMFNHYNG